MEWNTFKESEKEYPEKIVEKHLVGFDKATSNLAKLSIIPLTDISLYVSDLRTRNDFVFEVVLTSQRLKNYRFKVFEFGYNVSLYPVEVILNTEISSQVIREFIKQRNQSGNLSLREEELSGFIEKVFKTEYFKEVVTGLMKISMKYPEPKEL